MGFELRGKVAVITGAGSGIGRETALACAREGMSLAICDIAGDAAARTAEDAEGHGVVAIHECIDVADPEAVDGFARTCGEAFGPADLLINNAGIGVFGSFADTELEDWRRLLDVNLMGVVHGCRSFLPEMRRRGRGHVVNVASQAGFQASPVLGAYSASKFAVLGFSEALRGELAPQGIGVTAVCPGVINTPITRTSLIRGERPEERREKLVRLYARRNYGADKVADRILKAVRRNRAVAPISPEAHFAYALCRYLPGASRWTSSKLADLTE